MKRHILHNWNLEKCVITACFQSIILDRCATRLKSEEPHHILFQTFNLILNPSQCYDLHCRHLDSKTRPRVAFPWETRGGLPFLFFYGAVTIYVRFPLFHGSMDLLPGLPLYTGCGEACPSLLIGYGPVALSSLKHSHSYIPLHTASENNQLSSMLTTFVNRTNSEIWKLIWGERLEWKVGAGELH